MLIDKRDILRLSADVRRIIDGQDVDLRDNREGPFSMLKNDIHTLADLKNEQVGALRRDKATLKHTLADISHQLKTPLTSMMIMADLLEGAPPEKQAEFIANIRTSLVRTEWLVSVLLKMAKLDAGMVQFSRESVPAGALAGLALEPLQVLLDLKNQSIAISGDAGLPCDRRWTAEALTNVIKNASEHSPDNETIRIESGENPICAWISVTDSGGGMSNAEIARIFKRFEGSRNETGYGIGLPLALAIMRGQNGDIQAENTGSGAMFTLKFFK
ncbi:MAG: HAMP domain-containing histidine kinase [Clostridiales Family XIII bacterium]|nr:HAMP domain-containing histidine kinase [Clostridiales Family XIII bacterium]